VNLPPTLLRVLEESGKRVLVYDIGRRVGALPRQTFADFEAACLPYPFPMQRKAWFAVVQTGDEKHAIEPVIWFLRLSLDEQGLMIPAERDYLLNRLLESAQARQQGEDPQAFLQDNPHAFTPREDRMALFHARLSADLGLPPSRFYAHALDYFGGVPGWDQWGFVGYQGIADVACRHADEPLDTAIAHLPQEPLIALCHCLEVQTPGPSLEAALLDRLEQATAAGNANIGEIAALVRSLSMSTSRAAVTAAIEKLLAQPVARNIEILAAISGRAWESLHDPAALNAYLARLAGNDHGQAAFEQCVSDVLSLPSLAQTVREALRSPDQPVGVREAFGRMAQPGKAPSVD